MGFPSRCLNGMLNGNIGVMKSMMAELTDETNMARGFSLVPLTWAVGSTVGSGISLLSFVFWLISDLEASYRRCAIASSRSLAKSLFAFFLGRIPILPAMSRYRYLCPPSIYSYCDFLEGGWLSTCRGMPCLHVNPDCEQRPSHKA